MRRILTLLLFMLAIVSVKASHIVGGDFYYEYISGDKYRITMKLYVDCYNGIPGAISDDEYANFGVFNADSSTLIKTHKIQRTGPVPITGTVYKCVVDLGNVCVNQYTYVFETDLPERKGGYVIAFQRCCRNKTINNIVNPATTGATYWVHIPDRKLVSVDNSPIFKEFPPIYLCTSFKFTFDHSATDKDGDSLNYELYQPFIGADNTLPRPLVPHNPPYQNVVWNTPYTTADQMAGNPILNINQFTGELTVTPNTIGQFVIGVLVKQYRKGVYIGETLRDFQFNVVDCQATVAALFKSFVKCSDTVNFADRSVGATKISWNFGDPASGINDTSTLSNPQHIYSRNGEYTVTLKAWNPACKDEYTMKVNISKQSHASFVIDTFKCISQIELTNTGSNFETFHWDFGDGNTSENTSPVIHRYKKSGIYNILLVTNLGSPCADSSNLLTQVNGSPPDSFVPVNVFTPDGDLLNDCFHFGGVLNSCSEIKITIFNRWGMKLFETKDFNECWNGRVDNTGEACPEGTYFYLCEYKGETTSINPRFSGTITLIRKQ